MANTDCPQHIDLGDLIRQPIDGGFFDWKVPTEHYSEDPNDAIFFYGGPFSNFVGGPHSIQAFQPWSGDQKGGGVYNTVEHFYQASKAKTLEDHRRIQEPFDPWKAKELGNRCDLRSDWEAIKYDYMLVGLREKFAEDPWRTILVDTGVRYIAEDSPTDFIWGIRDKNGNLNGLNLLGRALMEIRAELVREDRMKGPS